MNFDNMPELHWELGYMFAWLLFFGILVLAIVLMWWYGYVSIRWSWLEKLQDQAQERRRGKNVSREVLDAAKEASKKGR
jgi:uncharacterized membrane protein (Fun14 family)